MSIIKPSAIDGISYIPSDSLAPAIKKLSFKEHRAFGVTDIRGEIPRGRSSELGIYFNDTRYLNTWETLINGQAPVPLAQELRNQGTSLVLSMTNRDLPILGEGGGRIPRDTLLIRRILTLHRDTLFEILTIRNFSGSAQGLQIEHWAGARFEDIFEVRGMTRQSRGKLCSPIERSAEHFILGYQGLDGRTRQTHLHRLYPAEKIRLAPYLTGYFTRIEIQPKEILTLRTVVAFDEPSELRFHGEDYRGLDAGSMMRLSAEHGAKPQLFDFSVETDNAIFNRSLDCAMTDIRMLLTRESESVLYPYAGVPWFSAPFGRDGIITAYQLLPWAPEVAKGVLDFVFSSMGSKFEDFTDEEPGKIFHELRRGEMASLREIPFIPYFGSVDATPLALILLHEYLCWTQDRESLERWWNSALRAADWMNRIGDSDQDLFLEYSRKSEKGLSNQGWKDSHDSVMHQDGTMADAPIRLCEVQAYAYRARLALAEIAEWTGRSEIASHLRSTALQLKAKFQEQFWDLEGKFVVLAIDGHGKPCRVRSSNMGHCLWGRILSPQQASHVSDLLLSESMFSGHGIRTLSDTETLYNPMSYHNGSIWPHDNALIAEGLKYYGKEAQLKQLAQALIEVLERSDDYRLPELYCGFRKRGLEPPIPYEVACKPQAWAAGSLFLLTKSMLGLSRSLGTDYLVVRNPGLPASLGEISIRNLSVQGKPVDLQYTPGVGGTRPTLKTRKGGMRTLLVRNVG